MNMSFQEGEGRDGKRDEWKSNYIKGRIKPCGYNSPWSAKGSRSGLRSILYDWNIIFDRIVEGTPCGICLYIRFCTCVTSRFVRFRRFIKKYIETCEYLFIHLFIIRGFTPIFELLLNFYHIIEGVT